jgi:Tol biopolymer transport system component
MSTPVPSGQRERPPSREEWRRLEPLVDAVLDAPPERRAALLVELSDGDEARRSQLTRLVAECDEGYLLLERPAVDRFAGVFADESSPLPELISERYRVLREAGRGGMAIVYVARDLRHGRDVAVKVVRPELTTASGRSRFLREIEIAARLRHPNIVPLFDSGEVVLSATDPGGGATRGSVLYYVMPYEPGHSLRERLARDGQLPEEEAVLILRDVCEALAHAHQHGIVHLDIKPDNVLLAGRRAMVTDFGVARAVSEATVGAPLPPNGHAVGTAAYMAPEQRTGDPGVDHRADIYSVGVLARELLTGEKPSAAGAEHRLRPLPNAALAALIARCLATRPADRWQSADELVGRLGALAAPGGPASAGSSRRPRVATILGLGLGAAMVTALAIAVMRGRADRPAPVLGEARQLTSDPGLEVQPAISPNGQYVAYAAGHALQMRIAVRPVAGGRATWLTSDSTATQWQPRWSPDGARILFLTNGGVASASAGSGVRRIEVPARPGAVVTSAAWSPDGRAIAYVRGDSLLALRTDTHDVRPITTGSDLHSCAWSPDGARLACVSGNSFYVTVGSSYGLGPMFGNLAPSRIVLIPAAGGAPVSVTDSGSLYQSPAWSRDGATLYYVSNRQGPRDVYALDVDARTAVGRQPVRVTTGLGAQSMSFAADGAHIVWAAYTSTANVWAMPIPRGHPGSAASAVQLTSGNQTVEGIRVSPDGRWLVYDSDVSGTSNVYRMPVSGGDPERLTRGPFDAFRGVLSPDGKDLVYHSYRTGSRNLFLLPLDGGPVQQLTRSSSQHSMANWSPDGSALTLFDMHAAQVFVMRRARSGRWSEPRVIGGPGVRPEWSPDGKVIAFVSPRDGHIRVAPADSGAQRELYVPGAGEPLAELAIFATNGREIYFKSHDARGRASFWVMSIAGGRPRLLARFDDPARASNRFEFASDGRRFYFTLEDRQSDIWIADIAPR